MLLYNSLELNLSPFLKQELRNSPICTLPVLATKKGCSGCTVMPSKPIWRWRNDDLKFVHFHPTDSKVLEDAWQAHTPSLSMTIKKDLYVMDLVNMTQKNTTTNRERLISRTSPEGVVESRAPIWEWESTDNVFVPYAAHTSETIERAFQNDDLTVKVPIQISAHDTRNVLIHFGHFQQMPEDHKEKTRRIRRVVRSTAAAAAATTASVGSSSSTPVVASSVPAPTLPCKTRTPAKKRDRTPDKPTPATKTEVDDTTPSSAKISIAETFPSPSSASKCAMKDWKMYGTCMYLNNVDAQDCSASTIKIAGFDLDDTLVKPASGALFAKSRSDWVWLTPQVVPKLQELHHRQGYRIVIFSNQSGIGNKGWDESKANDVRGKILDLSENAKVPISAVIATKEDEFRKPTTGMLDAYRLHLSDGKPLDLKGSFYCGDAAGRHILTLAGRKKDFSCSDRKFAYNSGMTFYTPEEFFEGKPPAPFDWDGLGPDDLKALPTDYPQAAYHTSSPELVIMVGFPGCGKSTFFKRFFEPHGYLHVNRDTLKTAEKCISATDSFLSQGKSVVVDNTNPSKEERSRYTKLASKHKVPVRCIWVQTSHKLANHMNIVRGRLGIVDRISSIAYNMYKSKFEEPNASEGFSQIVPVPMVANFNGLPEKAKEYFFELS